MYERSSKGRGESTSSSSSKGGVRTARDPQCFVALFMRPEGDTRLASVYKPWARKEMLSLLQLQHHQQQQQGQQQQQQPREVQGQQVVDGDLTSKDGRESNSSGGNGHDGDGISSSTGGGGANDHGNNGFSSSAGGGDGSGGGSTGGGIGGAGSGVTLLALVGDQFSDLNGDNSAPFAFKLPNPFYYIL
jgi:hypothetical protein